MEVIDSKFKRYLAKDRIVALRISKREEALLRNEAKRQEKSMSRLIREGFLGEIQ